MDEIKLRRKWRDRNRTIRLKLRRNVWRDVMLLCTIRVNKVRCQVFTTKGGGFWVKADNGEYATIGAEDNIFEALQDMTSPYGLGEDAA